MGIHNAWVPIQSNSRSPKAHLILQCCPPLWVLWRRKEAGTMKYEASELTALTHLISAINICHQDNKSS